MGLTSSTPGVDLNSVEAKFIREKISENCVVIFSKTQCPHCTEAKGIFKNLNVSYEVVELDKITNGHVVGDILVHMTNARTNGPDEPDYGIDALTELGALYGGESGVVKSERMENDFQFKVPRVFVKGQCVGGASETISLYRSGQLAKMVEGCS